MYKLTAYIAFITFILPSLLTACDGATGNQNQDPVVIDQPIAYVKRTIPENDAELFEPAMFNPGAALFLRNQASPSASEINLTQGLFPADEEYDIKDLESSYDGRRLLFALRAPEIEDADPEDQPTWNIWQYDLDSNELSRIISSDIQAEAGQDIAPHYLPDGRIVFSSTRQRQTRATLLDESKPQYSALDEDRNVAAFVLHLMDDDGSNIKQISFNPSHDLDPSVLNSGEILFSRWNHIDDINSVSLYTIHPDGTELTFVYGHHSQDTATNNTTARFTQARQLENAQIMALLREDSSSRFNVEPISIDTEQYTELNENIGASLGLTGTAQNPIGLSGLRIDGLPTAAGQLNSIYPLYDSSNRYLISWSPCRIETSANTIQNCDNSALNDPNSIEAAPLYSLWLLDNTNNTQLPLGQATEGLMYSDVIALEDRTVPTVIYDKQAGIELDQNLVDSDVGILHIRSVYDIDGVDSTASGISALSDPAQTLADQRPARFLRIEKSVPIPDQDLVDLDNSDFGTSGDQLMRDIIGYTPIQPDGSVKIQVPANIPFMISVLDKSGRRIGGRHQNWLQLRPGEERECSGCHTANSNKPHGRPNAEAASINLGASTSGLPFPNTETSLFTDIGETMAETWARINGMPSLSVDINYSDDWTDNTVRAKDSSFSYLYNNLSTPVPTSPECITAWSSLCRTTIHYPTHIHPLWEVDRSVDTCTTCHNSLNAASESQVPAAQLDLTGGASTVDADHLVSYRELLSGDNEQEINMGALTDRLIQDTDAQGNLLFELNIDGTLKLDVSSGDPIPVMVTIVIEASMSTNGANNSRFFDVFNTGGSHENRLNPDELRLLSEWLDIGGQYYNDPFSVPP